MDGGILFRRAMLRRAGNSLEIRDSHFDVLCGRALLQAPFCAMVITAVELAFGEVVNRAMGLGVWDYSELPLNFMGQICLPFSAIWLALSFPALLAARVLRTAMFGDKFVRPRLGVKFKRHEEAKRESI